MHPPRLRPGSSLLVKPKFNLLSLGLRLPHTNKVHGVFGLAHKGMRGPRATLVHRNTEHQDKEMLERSSPHRLGWLE